MSAQATEDSARRGSLYAVADPPPEKPWEHTFTCLLCGHAFHTIGGGNWPEPIRTTCGDCLRDPEPEVRAA